MFFIPSISISTLACDSLAWANQITHFAYLNKATSIKIPPILIYFYDIDQNSLFYYIKERRITYTYGPMTSCSYSCLN